MDSYLTIYACISATPGSDVDVDVALRHPPQHTAEPPSESEPQKLLYSNTSIAYLRLKLPGWLAGWLAGCMLSYVYIYK